MSLRSKLRKVMCMTLCFCTLSVISVSAKSDKEGDITITQNNVGNVSVSTTYTGGVLLYSYEYGTSKDKLRYPQFEKGSKVSYYNEAGDFIKDETVSQDTPLFSDDVGTWQVVNNVKPKKDSDYYKASETYAVLQKTSSIGKDTVELDLNMLPAKCVVKVSCAYKFKDGSISEVKSYLGKIDYDEIIANTNPVVTISEAERTADLVKLNIISEVKAVGVSLVSMTITDSLGNQDEIELSGNKKTITYTIDHNDTYNIFVTTDSGTGYRIGWLEDELSGLGTDGSSNLKDNYTDKDLSDTKGAVLTFSQIPEKMDNGDHFTLTANANEVCDITVDGKTYNDTTKIEYDIYSNGIYTFVAVDKGGNISQYPITVNCFPSDNGSMENVNFKSSDLVDYWGSKVDSDTKKLPQTGGILLAVLGILFVGGLCGGIYVLKHKKPTDKEADNNDKE